MNTLSAVRASTMLANRLTEAATNNRTLAPDQILEQRISFVFGSMDLDSAVTRDQVKQLIMKDEGMTLTQA